MKGIMKQIKKIMNKEGDQSVLMLLFTILGFGKRGVMT